MLAGHVAQQVRLLLKLPVAKRALKPGLDAALVLHVVLEALARLIEPPAAVALVTHSGQQQAGGQGGGWRRVVPPGGAMRGAVQPMEGGAKPWVGARRKGSQRGAYIRYVFFPYPCKEEEQCQAWRALGM